MRKMRVWMLLVLVFALGAAPAEAGPISPTIGSDTYGANWQPMVTPDESGNTYWNGRSLDGALRNIGNLLTGTHGGGAVVPGGPFDLNDLFWLGTSGGGAASAQFFTPHPMQVELILRETALEEYDMLSIDGVEVFGPNDAVGAKKILPALSGAVFSLYNGTETFDSWSSPHRFAFFLHEPTGVMVGCLEDRSPFDDCNDLVWKMEVISPIVPDPDPDPNNPVPEPGTMALLGSGLVALYGRVRKKHKEKKLAAA